MAASPKWSAVLFDLDGTLIDTRPGMRAALEAALIEVTGDDSGANHANLSLPLDAMIRTAAPDAPSAMVQRLSSAFRRHYDSGDWRTAEVYPQAEEALRTLEAAGVRTFIVTNKRGVAARRLLEHYHLARYFEGVAGQPESGVPVPKQDLADRLLEDMGLDPATTVVVGDSDQDASMAASRQLVFIAITSGAGPLTPASAGQNRVEMDSLADVAAFVVEGTLWRKS